MIPCYPLGKLRNDQVINRFTAEGRRVRGDFIGRIRNDFKLLSSSQRAGSLGCLEKRRPGKEKDFP